MATLRVEDLHVAADNAAGVGYFFPINTSYGTGKFLAYGFGGINSENTRCCLVEEGDLPIWV